MHLHELPADVETQTGATGGLPGANRIKLVEDTCPFVHRHPWSFVLHTDLHDTLHDLEPHRNRGPCRRELDGVDQEIGDHMVDQAAVGQDEREVHVRLDVYLLALQFRPGSNVRYHVLDTMDQVERAQTQDYRAGLQPGARQGAVDRPLQPCQVALDGFQISPTRTFGQVGQLLIRTFGLLMVVVNTAMFWLLIRFTPFAWQIQEPAWLWILVAAGLISIAVTLLDALLGLDQPQLDEEGRGQFIWQWFERVPGWMTEELVENVRTEQCLRTINRYGLDIALAPTPFSRLRNQVEI